MPKVITVLFTMWTEKASGQTYELASEQKNDTAVDSSRRHFSNQPRTKCRHRLL